jgi:hypothetical protein
MFLVYSLVLSVILISVLFENQDGNAGVTYFLRWIDYILRELV